MAAYLDGLHHPRAALAPRIAFVSVDGARVIAYIAAHATTRSGCAGEGQYLYVNPAYRRSGVARRLLDLVARWFHARDIRRVCVNADIESEGAVPFYTALGATPLNPHWYVWDDIGRLVRRPLRSGAGPTT
jgi:GNAT superfamily N-acetyltransferase